MSGEVSVLCWLAAPVAMFYGNLPKFGNKVKIGNKIQFGNVWIYEIFIAGKRKYLILRTGFQTRNHNSVAINHHEMLSSSIDSGPFNTNRNYLYYNP